MVQPNLSEMSPAEFHSFITSLPEKPDEYTRLRYIQIAKDKAHSFLRNKDTASAMQWAAVIDSIYVDLIDNRQGKYYKHLYNRIMFRHFLLGDVGVNEREDLRSMAVIIDWLRQEFAEYSFEEVKKLAYTWEYYIYGLSDEEYSSLVRLKKWIKCLRSVNTKIPMIVPRDLEHWLSLHSRLANHQP